jgi:hypothetical protein
MHEVGLHRLEDGSIDKGAFKIVYVAPMKVSGGGGGCGVGYVGGARAAAFS